MVGNTILDDVRDFMRTFLGDNRSQQALRLYAELLGSICELISYTHSIVIDGLNGIEKAKSLQEAKRLAEGLRADPLMRSFRGRMLCDRFEEAGSKLRRAVIRTDDPNPPRDKLVATTDEQWNALMKFCNMFELREHAVATGYVYQIRELSAMLSGVDTVTDLNEIKAKARGAKDVLTDQKADFDALAAQFRRKLSGRN